MRGLRRASLAVLVVVAMAAGGSAVARSGPSGDGPTDRPHGQAPFSEVPSTETQGDPSGRETIHLFGLQEPEEAFYITVDGRVFGADPPPFQEPGTSLLAAELSGQNEVDDAGTPGAGDLDGTGTAQLRLVFDPPEVCARLTVADIDLPAVAAHIHAGPAGVNGPVVVTLPTPGQDGTADGCVTEGVTTQLLEDIAANPAGYYVNVHNAPFPAGAVRGQLTPDPDAVIPSPGDRTVFRERLFALDNSDPDNPEPTGDQLGTVVVECTAVTMGAAPEDQSWICSRVFTLDDRGDIAVQESFTFADPIEDTLSVTGGTGEFRDVGGQVSFAVEEIPDAPVHNSIYSFHLLHLR